MRVLHVGKYYPPVEGGIENHVASLCSALAPVHRVTALVFNTTARTVTESRDGVRVVRAATLGRLMSTEMAPSFFFRFLRLRRADLIHLHTPNPIGELACLMAPASARLVITYHSDVVRQRMLGRLNRVVLHRLMRRADRIIAFTRRYMETSPVISRHAEKCAIIPHGIDLTEFEPSPATDAFVDRIRAQHGSRLVLFVGRLVYYKGVDHLLRALTRIPDATLLIIGDGPMRPSLEKLSEDLGLGTRARFLGRVGHEEKVACYRASRFLVLPATQRSEAFGLVQLEAQASGIPVISTNIDSGVPFVNKHEETGLVVEPGDDEALSGAMKRLLGDQELCARFGLAGRSRVERLFSREVMIRDVMSLYREVAGDSAPASVPAGRAPGVS